MTLNNKISLRKTLFTLKTIILLTNNKSNKIKMHKLDLIKFIFHPNNLKSIRFPRRLKTSKNKTFNNSTNFRQLQIFT